MLAGHARQNFSVSRHCEHPQREFASPTVSHRQLPYNAVLPSVLQPPRSAMNPPLHAATTPSQKRLGNAWSYPKLLPSQGYPYPPKLGVSLPKVDLKREPWVALRRSYSGAKVGAIEGP